MSEKGEAKRDGARLHRNSGRGILEKGDATLGPFVVDYKEYSSGFTVSRTAWFKASQDATKMHGEPALRLVLGDESTPNKLRLWVIGDEMFHQMKDAWEQVYGE